MCDDGKPEKQQEERTAKEELSQPPATEDAPSQDIISSETEHLHLADNGLVPTDDEEEDDDSGDDDKDTDNSDDDDSADDGGADDDADDGADEDAGGPSEESALCDTAVAEQEPPRVREGTRIESQLGLIFPVARVTAHLREATGRRRVSADSGIAMTAAMGSLAEYILEASERALPVGPKTKQRKRSTLTPRELQMSRSDNSTMVDILCRTTVAYGGVLQRMPPSLLGARKRKRRPTKKKETVNTKEKKRRKAE